MAQPTTTTIDNLTRCLRLPGIYPGGYVDQFIRVIRFEEIEGYGRSVQINGATSLGSVAAYSAGGTMSAVQATTDLTTFTFERIGGTAQVDVADIEASGAANNQLELQVQTRKIALIRELSSQLIQGSGVAPNLEGLETLVGNTGNFVDLSNVAPTLADYHRLVSMVNASDGAVGTGPDALVMNWNARRQLQSLIEAAGGDSSCCFVEDDDLDVPVMKFDGIPICVTEALPASSPTTILAVKIHGDTGVRVLHVGGDSEEFGIAVDDVPNQMTVNERAKLVRGYYTILYPETGTVAALMNANVSTFVP